MSPATRKAFGDKLGVLKREGYSDPKQRLAIGFSELRKGGIKRLKKVSGKRKHAKGRD